MRRAATGNRQGWPLGAKAAMLGLALGACPSVLFALVPLHDEEMSGITGQDGLVVDLAAGNSQTIREVEWRMDDATAESAALLLQHVSLDLVNGAQFSLDVGGDTITGTGDGYVIVQGSWTDLQARIGALGHSHYRDNAPLVMGQPDRTVDRSVGILGLESTGFLNMGGVGSFLNFGDEMFPATAQSLFELVSMGYIFYLQSTGIGAPELSFANFLFSTRITDSLGNPGFGRAGFTPDGLTLKADYMDFDLNFDLFIAPNTIQEFDKVSRRPMILFGWEGGIENATLGMWAGGVGYGSSTDLTIDPSGTLQFFNYKGQYNPANRSQGLTLHTQWDYRSDFTWVLGQAAGDRSRADFFDWQRLGVGSGNESPYDFSISLILDAINAGQGPGGICFGGNIPTSGSLTAASCGAVGGTLLNVVPKDNNLAVIIRDGGAHAYNTQVRVRDVDGLGFPTEDRFDWSLFYTFGKLDANIYIYPDGVYDGGTSQYGGGLRNDILLAIQSPGYWEAAQTNFASVTVPGDPAFDPRVRWPTNTHFLVADTDINGVATGNSPSQAQLDARQSFGIGILNADLIWRVDDFNITLVGDTAPAAPPGSSDWWAYSLDYPGLWLETNNLAKYQFRGLFGGGDLTDLSDPARISLLDVNLETDRFLFVLGPPRLPGEQYVAFDALMRFTSGAYLTLAEPSTPSAYVGLENVTGNIAWIDGRIELEGSQQTGTGRPELTIANDLLIGATTATLGGGQHLITDVTFGADRLGSIVIPSSQIRSTFSLTPQN